jgi:hypothetical protein
MSPSWSRCSEAIDEPFSISAPFTFRYLGFTIRAFGETNNSLKVGVARLTWKVACWFRPVEEGCLPLLFRIRFSRHGL